MDKDRDISRRITISTPKKVSFVGGAVLVLGVLGQWKAWQIPEGTNVPIGQGGE